MWTTQDVLSSLPSPTVHRLPAPSYLGAQPTSGNQIPIGVGLAVKSMQLHTTDEGWQIFAGLEEAGYTLAGRGLPIDEVDVPRILSRIPDAGVVVVQDKREWDLVTARDFRDPSARFTNVSTLAGREDLFKVTLLKDAQQRPPYHRESAEEIGCHAWIVYYAPSIVGRLASYIRPEHVLRVYHSVDRGVVPAYSAAGRKGCLLSGARGAAYPLRERLIRQHYRLPETTYLPHPTYQRRKCFTPEFLQTLCRYRVAICTSSRYGFAVRKIIEATACGCAVITDLPIDEVLPFIDGNLVRVRPDVSTEEVANIIQRLGVEYDAERQQYFAARAVEWYDYRASGLRLASAIERLRLNYRETSI